ncbi:MAG: alpha/beta hydrolase [Planctomycetes bacterium]|nr:alpha/beta hydrolase [Planctomycetota bacterium]
MTKPAASMWRRALRVARLPFLGVAGFYLLLMGLAMGLRDRYVFFPTRFPQGDWAARDRTSCPIEEVEFPAADGVKLVAWYARPPEPRGTVLFFHGNAGNISDRLFVLEALASIGLETLGVDYRGYGKSEGSPSEAGLLEDAEGAYRYLTEQRGVPPARLILFGKSLGGAPVIDLATRHACAGLIVQSAFTSIADMAARIVPVFPIRWMIRSPLDNLSKIRRVAAPKLLLHSRDDEIVPYEMGLRLYEAAPPPKSFVEFEGVGHNDLIALRTERWIEAISSFVTISFEN